MFENYPEKQAFCLEMVQCAMEDVAPEYWSIHMANTKNVKRRERVYCYELYHQMRKYQEAHQGKDGYVLNGEIDKRSHPVIAEGFNPDFLLHQQGTMNNLCVMEVKTSSAVAGIAKDFQTILLMMHGYSYRYGVFILTGCTRDEFEHSILGRLRDDWVFQQLSGKHAPEIQLFFQKAQGEHPETCRLSEMLDAGRA